MYNYFARAVDSNEEDVLLITYGLKILSNVAQEHQAAPHVVDVGLDYLIVCLD